MTTTNQAGPLLPRGCRLRALKTLPDRRGDLTEMFREEWFESPPPRLWHIMRSRANTVSGIRVYARDWLYLCLMDGVAWVSLTDLCPTASADTTNAQLVLSEAPRRVLVIAPGVAYGFHFPQPACYLLGRVETEDPAGHLLCAWDSPDLEVAWPCTAPDLSASDQGGVNFAEFKADFTALLAKHAGA